MKSNWHIFKLTVLLFTVLHVVSCKENNISKDVQDLIGKHISIPSEISRENTFAIINYVDSTGCTSCKLHTEGWNMFIEKTKDCNSPIDIIFIVHPHVFSDVNEIINNNCTNQIKVICDTKNRWKDYNKLSQKEMLHTFLINKDNNIVMVGSPITNVEISDLMLKVMKDLN